MFLWRNNGKICWRIDWQETHHLLDMCIDLILNALYMVCSLYVTEKDKGKLESKSSSAYPFISFILSLIHTPISSHVGFHLSSAMKPWRPCSSCLNSASSHSQRDNKWSLAWSGTYSLTSAVHKCNTYWCMSDSTYWIWCICWLILIHWIQGYTW